MSRQAMMGHLDDWQEKAMPMWVSKLLAMGEQLERSEWTAKYLGASCPVQNFRVKRSGNELVIRCVITYLQQQLTLELVEHIEGGGDFIAVGGQHYDADHEVGFRFKPFTVKVIVKTVYDADDQPGLEQVLYLTTKVKVALI